MIVVYLDITDSILKKTTDRSFHALHIIMRQMNMEENKWYSDSVNKTAICEELGVTRIALDKMLASLKKRDLLFSYQRGILGLNPEIFTT